MLLPLEYVLQGLLHADRQIRDAVAYFFSAGNVRDPAAMPLVIQAIEDLSWHEAFGNYDFLSSLNQTDSTLDWLMERLRRLRRSRSAMSEHVRAATRDSIVRADTALLSRRLSDLLSLFKSDDEARNTIVERIEIAALPAEELWQRFESVCRDNYDEEGLPHDARMRIFRLLEGLRQHPAACVYRVMKILDNRAVYYWPLDMAVILAGEIRLEAAVPRLLEILEEGSWVFEECEQALANIGKDELVDQLGERFLTADQLLQDSIVRVLAQVYSQQSISTRIELAACPTDLATKCRLLASALTHFATDSIEPGRQLVLQSERDLDVQELRNTLIIACKVMGISCPESHDRDLPPSHDEIYRRSHRAPAHSPALVA